MAEFAGLVDLLSDRVGGCALLASDEFFAEKENLVTSGRGTFIPGKYTDRGKWMDGWETRRKRVPGHDWCILRLGLTGVIKGVDIDTNHFLGNHPPYASVEACTHDSSEVPAEDAKWIEIVQQSPLMPGSQNLFAANVFTQAFTHVRLNIIPDGGVARFRVYGEPMPRWQNASPESEVDLAAIENGGRVILCNDMRFGSMENLILPGRARNMGEGWETRRSRVPGNDWVILKLGAPGNIQRVEVDTLHYKGNYPDRCSLEGCCEPDASIDELTRPGIEWAAILPPSKLEADRLHEFSHEVKQRGPFTHVRFNIYPDGGVGRLRVFGKREDGSEP